MKRDLFSDEPEAELRRVVAEHQRGQVDRQTQRRRQLCKIDSAIDRVTETIAEALITKGLSEKLNDLVQQRDHFEAQLGYSPHDPVRLLPRVVDRWRDSVGNMVDLALHPDPRLEDFAKAREHLSALLGHVRLIPEDGHLVAIVGLQAPDSEPHIQVVAGA